MTFEEAYQQIRKHHCEILDERESISKSARLSLSTWVLDILTECRDTADTPQTDCRTCKWAEVSWTSHYCDDCKAHNKYEPNDTPQTDCQW